MSYTSAAAMVQDLLFLFLLLAAPVWDFRHTRRLKQNPNSAGKIRYYKTLCGWLWSAAAVALLAVGSRPLFTIIPMPNAAPWLFAHGWVRYGVGGAIGVYMALVLLPPSVAIWKSLTKRQRRYSSADALKSLSYFFPATTVERRWYAFLCVTAGVCEEILFRGFLLHYLHVFPFSLNLALALVISSAIFGLQHFYLGAAGAVSSAVGGLLFGFLFLLTGNLLPAIVFHAAMDLRVLVLLRPPADEKAS